MSSAHVCCERSERILLQRDPDCCCSEIYPESGFRHHERTACRSWMVIPSHERLDLPQASVTVSQCPQDEARSHRSSSRCGTVRLTAYRRITRATDYLLLTNTLCCEVLCLAVGGLQDKSAVRQLEHGTFLSQRIFALSACESRKGGAATYDLPQTAICALINESQRQSSKVS